MKGEPDRKNNIPIREGGVDNKVYIINKKVVILKNEKNDECIKNGDN
jgi:hypothetical protein